MKITKAEIKNFRALETVSVELNEFSVILGENDVGKTSFLYALEKFFSQKKLADQKDWYKGETDEPIQVILTFSDLPAEETDENFTGLIRKDESIIISATFGFDAKPEYNATLDDTSSLPVPSGLLKKWFSQNSFHFIPVRRDINVQFTMAKTALLGKLLRTKMKTALEDAGAADSLEKISSLLEGAITEPREKMEGYLKEQLNKDAIKLEFDDLEIDPVEGVNFSVHLSDDQARGIDIASRGAGTQNNLIIALFRLIAEANMAENFIFAMEEPENSLHPKAQRQLLSVIQKISESNQVLVTTHSPVFIDRSKFESNIILTRTSIGNTTAKTFNVDLLESVRTDLGIKTSDALLKGGGNCAVLVEGKTEEDCFPVFMEMHNLSEFELGTSIINMGGSDFQRARRIIQLLKGYEIPCIIVLDRDAKETEEELIRMIPKPLDNLRNIFRLTEGTIEDYFPDDIIVQIINSELSPSEPLDIKEVDTSLSGKENLEQYKRLMYEHGAGEPLEFLKRALGAQGSKLMRDRKKELHPDIVAILDQVREIALNN
jgi:predicted ATP-dependent endonuclease of OLD family